MVSLFVVYILGLLYFLPPIEGYSLEENTLMAFLWPLMIIFVLLVFLSAVVIAGYAEVKRQFF